MRKKKEEYRKTRSKKKAKMKTKGFFSKGDEEK